MSSDEENPDVIVIESSDEETREDELSSEDSNQEENGKSDRKTKKKKVTRVKINRYMIPSIAEEDQEDELLQLGVTAYDQSCFEKGVMKQLTDVMGKDGQPKATKDDEEEEDEDIDTEVYDQPSTSKRMKKVTIDFTDALDDNQFSIPTSVPLRKFTALEEEEINRIREESSDEESVEEYKLPKGYKDDEDDDDEEEEEEKEEDSDECVSSDYEDRPKKGNAKRTKKQQKKVTKKAKMVKEEEECKWKKVRDDGDDKTFQKRMRKYYKKLMNELPDKSSTEDLFDYVTVEDDFKVPKQIWDKLFPHQQQCVRWLYELHKASVGGIVGDEMGLGKTIQVIAFLTGLRCSKTNNFRERYKKLGPCIIVCPATVMSQWVSELHEWWPEFRVAILHSSGSYCKKDKETLIHNMNKGRGILLMTYAGAVEYQDTLFNYDWHYVVLDEGHKIRNPDAQMTIACKRFRTPHRLILSGSPIQNNLKELWSLFDFIYPGKLGTLPIFMEKFAVPITQGGYSCASDVQVKIAYKCALVLRDTIKPYLLRRMKDDLKDINLPSKNEQVLFCKLTEEQRNIYQDFLDRNPVKDLRSGTNSMFAALVILRKICNHPDLYEGFKGKPSDEIVKWDPLNQDFDYFKRSGKMQVVDALLRLWHKQGHRVLLFSQGTKMMRILEKFIKFREYTYFQMDGGTPIGSRHSLINEFNNRPEIFIFLLTTRVGGIGVNLTSANRVLIFDPDWNPTTDMQARERAWRIGQKNQVTIYRLLTAGSIEEKMYHRQVFKQFLTNKVLKDPKQRRFFKNNDLYELFSLGDEKAITETHEIFEGTNSEVPAPKRSHKKKKHKKSKNKDKNRNDQSDEEQEIVLSPEKIAQLREKARLTSEKIKKMFSQNSEPSTPPMAIPTTSTISSPNGKKEGSKPSPPSTSRSPPGLEHVSKRKSRKEKDKKKGCMFEGERIESLVRSSVAKDDRKEKMSQKQDDYVLQKLFEKSGSLHSAIQHDAIEGATNPDYSLVEAEAEEIAADAIAALRKSRTSCFSANSGIPTWTGANGALNAAANRPLMASAPSAAPPAAGAPPAAPSTSGIKLSLLLTKGVKLGEKPKSLSFLEAINGRRRIEPNDAVERPPPLKPQSSHEMLRDQLREFIQSQGRHPGQAETNEILKGFKEKLAIQNTPVLKALLTQMCNFERSGLVGIWKLKEEFA